MRSRRAFTLIEAVISTVVVGLMLAAALNVAGASRVTSQRTIDRQSGVMLAQSLMTEILAKPYAEPTEALLFGPELLEDSLDRSTFDDIDDFDGYVETPPAEADGNPIEGFTGWRRLVVVRRVSTGDLRTVLTADSGYKLITVTVKRGKVAVAELVALRSQARDGI